LPQTIETSLRHVDAMRGEVELLFAERNVLNSAREQVKSGTWPWLCGVRRPLMATFAVLTKDANRYGPDVR
jgi:hypothetical protein